MLNKDWLQRGYLMDLSPLLCTHVLAGSNLLKLGYCQSTFALVDLKTAITKANFAAMVEHWWKIVASGTGISEGSVQTIFKKHLRKIGARWVSHLLT